MSRAPNARRRKSAPGWPLLAVWVLACLLPAAPALGQTSGSVSADEAELQFRLGNEAYKRKDFQTALAHYFASNRLAPNRNVTFNLARCYEQLKRYVEAYRYYQAFGQAELTAKERRVLADALERVRPSVALVRIESQPPGATIYVDRKELGTYGITPTTVALAPGTYRVLLERAGYKDFEQAGLKTAVGAQAEVRGELERIAGRLAVSGEPAGALVRVEDPAGAQVASLPVQLTVTPGALRVVVSRDGYVPHEATVTVKPNGDARLEVRLRPQTGTLLVQADERDALILIDGRPAGFTPAVLDDLPAGPHDVVIQQAGFQPFKTRVEVKPADRTLVEASLQIVEDVAAASRLVEGVRDAPASVSLVSRREISAFGYTDAADAAAGLRGAYLSNDGTYQSLGLRGYSPFGQYGNRLLVLLDGHSLNDDWIGSSYVGDDLMVSLDPIERIELIRGPGSALYGTGAFFGVLNLVSPAGAPASWLNADLSTLGAKTLRAAATVGSPLGSEAGFWLSGGGLWGQGGDFLSPARVGSAEAPDGVARGVGASQAGTILGRVFWRDLTLEFYFNQREKQIPTGAFSTVFGDTRTRALDARSFAEVRYEPRFGDLFQLLARLTYDHYGYDGVFVYPDDVARESYRGDWTGAEVRGVLTPGAGLRLTLGGSWEMHFANPGRGQSDGEVDPYYLERHPFQTFAGYAVADWRWAWLSLSAGGRFDGWLISDLAADTGGTEDRFLYSINPRLAIILRPSDNDTLKLLGGRAFRAPSIYELTYWDGGLTQIQSPDLQPETIYTAELEYSRRLPGSFWLVAGVFFNYISDLIEQTGAGTDVDPLKYENQSEALYSLGGELELRREFRRGWMLGLQVSYQHTRLGGLIDGQEPANSPPVLGGLKAVAPLAGRALQISGRVLVEMGRLDRLGARTDPAVQWDATLGGELPEYHLRYALGLRNLLDWDIVHPAGEEVLDTTLRQPGLSVFLDVGLTF